MTNENKENAADKMSGDKQAKAAPAAKKQTGKMTVCANGFVDVNVGEIQNMWGVPFTCEACEGVGEDHETVETKRLIATLPAKEAQTMIDIGRVVEV